MIEVNVNYETDESVETIEEEQAYYNMMDGEVVFIVEDRGDEVTVLDMTGSVEIWAKEGTIFQDEYVWTDLIPVEWSEIEVDQ